MEVRKNMIDALKASNSQKLAKIDKLKCELHEQNKMIRYLSKEVALGRWKRDRASEQVESDRHVVQHLKTKLEKERAVVKREVSEGLVEQTGEGSVQDSWVISLEKKKGGEAESEVQPIQVPYAANSSRLPSLGDRGDGRGYSA
ncbi:uncharacterized protein A4U43_C08F18940 [Asparagus officinalis]|nr:uncharacterized protein A4U43_C08F18940 [Asparagus officinalis]